MYRVPRKKRYIGPVIALLLLALLAVGVYGIVSLLSGTPDYAKSAILLPSNNPGVYPYADGVLTISERQMVCFDLQGKILWDANLPTDNMKAARLGKLTAVWGDVSGGGVVEILDEKGISITVLNTVGSVVTVALSPSQYAVVTNEDGQPRMRLYNLNKEEPFDEVLFTDEQVLGVGFYGEKDKLTQLWTLFIDSHGTQPVTKLNTYYPGRSTTGSIELDDEVGYKALLRDKTIYMLGTHTLSSWDHSGSKKSSKLVYGWYLQDMLVEDTGRVTYLLAPVGGAEDTTQISALWSISSDGTEYKVPLPAGCIRAMLKADRSLVVATGNGVYSMAADGTRSRFHPVGFTIENISAVVPGKAFVAQTKHGSYLLPMPSR